MTKKKQNAKAMNVSAARAHMENLISAHESAAQDGRLEIATAIAMTSSQVTVDASTDPFTTFPINLFTLTFADQLVGIQTEDLMRVFLENLKTQPLLAQISADIDKIPATPAMEIRLVVRFVRLALLQD